MKIAFVIAHFERGGAELSLSTLINALVSRGHDISLIARIADPDFAREALDPACNVISVPEFAPKRSAWGSILRYVRLVRKLRDIVETEQFHAVVPFLDRTNIFVLLALADKRIPIVPSERCVPRFVLPGWQWTALRALAYRKASGVVTVSRDGVSGLALSRRTPRVCLPGPISPPSAVHPLPVTLDPKPKFLVAAGRLTHQKGMDLLISAFAKIASEFPHWILKIYGSGELRRELEELCHRYEIESRVEFCGVVPDLASHLHRAEIFVLPSRFEGFPRVLAEAMMLGRAVVATKCPGAVADIVTDRANGLLCPTEDVPALSAALRELMTDGELRQELGAAAKSVAELCSPTFIAEGWERFLVDVGVGQLRGNPP